VKTRRRNMAAAVAFFAFAVLLSPFAGYWLSAALGVPGWIVLLASLVYGSVMVVSAQVLFFTLQDVTARRRHEAEMAELDERWSRTMGQNGYRS
jgi:uncharacterized membrane protein